jgi:hypothetical protein
MVCCSYYCVYFALYFLLNFIYFWTLRLDFEGSSFNFGVIQGEESQLVAALALFSPKPRLDLENFAQCTYAVIGVWGVTFLPRLKLGLPQHSKHRYDHYTCLLANSAVERSALLLHTRKGRDSNLSRSEGGYPNWGSLWNLGFLQQYLIVIRSALKSYYKHFRDSGSNRNCVQKFNTGIIHTDYWL